MPNRTIRPEPVARSDQADTATGASASKLWANCLDLPKVLSAPEKALDFVLPGLLAGTVGLAVSPGGAGKSMLAIGLAVSIAVGRDPWGLIGSDPKQGPVLILSLEDPELILGQRMRALAASCPDIVPILKKQECIRLAARYGSNFVIAVPHAKNGIEPSSACEILRSEIKELRPRLLVIDTLNRALGGISENDNAIQGLVISLIESLIQPTGTAALVLHHTSKVGAGAGQDEIQQAARGASAITDNARFQLNLEKMKEEERRKRGISEEDKKRWLRTIVSKCNYSMAPPDRWLWRGDRGVLTAKALPPVIQQSSPSFSRESKPKKPRAYG